MKIAMTIAAAASSLGVAFFPGVTPALDGLEGCVIHSNQIQRGTIVIPCLGSDHFPVAIRIRGADATPDPAG